MVGKSFHSLGVSMSLGANHAERAGKHSLPTHWRRMDLFALSGADIEIFTFIKNPISVERKEVFKYGLPSCSVISNTLSL